jgi:hypothetical protein
VPDEAARTYARQLADSAERALRKIQDMQKARVFRGIQPEALSDTTLQVLPDHPLYLAIHRVGRRIAEPGLAYAPGQNVVSALKHSFDLFELAVLYRLVAALADALGPSWRPFSSSLVRRHPHEIAQLGRGLAREMSPLNWCIKHSSIRRPHRQVLMASRVSAANMFPTL